MKYTCGIYLFDLERDTFLAVHPTNVPINVWSVPKGIPDEDEDHLAAALREFMEETSVDLKPFIDSGDVKMFRLPPQKYTKQQKTLVSFLAVAEKNCHHRLHCASMVTGETDFGGFSENKKYPFPEVDAFWWMPLDGSMHLHETQQANITLIRQITQQQKNEKNTHI